MQVMKLRGIRQYGVGLEQTAVAGEEGSEGGVMSQGSGGDGARARAEGFL